MANLKEKILQSLKNSKELEPTLNTLSKSQENLLKNYSNPVINNKDKGKLLKSYTDLQDIGKSVYRYNTLQEHNYSKDAQDEKENIETKVLKGGVSYNKYIWHSENGEHTCDVCADLDGQEFDYYDEVPERPHPNCKCYVEIVEYDDENSIPETNENEELCDTIDEIEALISDIEGGIQESESLVDEVETEVQDLEKDVLGVQNLIQDADTTLEILSEEYEKHLPECENNVDADYAYMYAKKAEWQTLLHDVLGILNPIGAFLNTLRIFISNYVELLYHAYHLKEFEVDKYYHSKANCEATQEMEILAEKYAEFLSNQKENFDQWHNMYARSHKVTIEEAIADSERDQVANRLGRERGRKYPYCDCSILMHDLLPDYKK